jgi:hypothetical protein
MSPPVASVYTTEDRTMTAHPRTANLSARIGSTIGMRATVRSSRPSTGRLVLVAASVVIEAVIVLGFVASSLGVGATAYPDPGSGRLAPPASTAPVSAMESNPELDLELDLELVHEPAPAPAPAP